MSSASSSPRLSPCARQRSATAAPRRKAAAGPSMRSSTSARPSSNSSATVVGLARSSARPISLTAAGSSSRDQAASPALASRSEARRATGPCPRRPGRARAVAGGLFQVVAEDLVQLDERLPVLARATRQSARGDRPASPWAARRKRRPGSTGDGTGTRPRRQARVDRDGRAHVARARRGAASPRVSSGASACTVPRWKISPSTEPRSSTAAPWLVELIEAGRQQRPQRRRHLHLAVRRPPSRPSP